MRKDCGDAAGTVRKDYGSSADIVRTKCGPARMLRRSALGLDGLFFFFLPILFYSFVLESLTYYE